MALRVDFKDKLTQWAIFCVLATVAGGYAHYTFLFVPRHEAIVQLTVEEDKLSRELILVKTQVQRLAQIRAELVTAEAEFAKLQEMFPDEERTPSRLQDLLIVTRKSGTVTTKFVPQPSVKKEFYAENNYKISTIGSYHSIGEMFAEFANFKYPTSIQRMTITVSPNLKTEMDNADKHGTIPNTVGAEFDFTTYTSGK